MLLMLSRWPAQGPGVRARAPVCVRTSGILPIQNRVGRPSLAGPSPWRRGALPEGAPVPVRGGGVDLPGAVGRATGPRKAKGVSGPRKAVRVARARGDWPAQGQRSTGPQRSLEWPAQGDRLARARWATGPRKVRGCVRGFWCACAHLKNFPYKIALADRFSRGRARGGGAPHLSMPPEQ